MLGVRQRAVYYSSQSTNNGSSTTLLVFVYHTDSVEHVEAQRTLNMPDLGSRMRSGSAMLSGLRGWSSREEEVKHTLWGWLHRPSMYCCCLFVVVAVVVWWWRRQLITGGGGKHMRQELQTWHQRMYQNLEVM